MRVLICFDINTRGEGNPYVFQLLQSLELNPGVDAVQHGTGWMQVPEADFDVFHIQWPEALLNGWREPNPNDLESIRRVFRRWSKEGVLVVTVHNEHPHQRDTPAFRKLYELVFRCADGVVHLGNSSKKVMRKRYSREMEASKEVVIPHGVYDWFINSTTSEEARNELGVDEDAKVLLSFGEHRKGREVDLVLEGFRKANISQKQLLLAGRLPYGSIRTPWHFTTRLPIWTQRDVHLFEDFIPSDRVKFYLRAADVLFIPRTDALNSGNVHLGFTFGKTVVGPDIGVIGEILKSTGNPTFNPSSIRSVSAAIEEGFGSLNIGKKNRQHAKKKWNWERISEMHLNFYSELKKQK